jgi:YVTN family beta-propeller protein
MPMRTTTLLLAVSVLACGRPAPSNTRAGDDLAQAPRLPTGERLDPDGRSFDLGSMPLAMVLSPEGDRAAVLLNGWREQGVQIVNPATGKITQDLRQPAAFLGLTFSPDGQWLFASGGNQDVVYRYAWRNGQATLQDSIVLAVRRSNAGTRYPAGLAVSRDGRALYVAENLADSLAVVDVSTGTVVQRFPTQRYPYGVVVGPGDEVYVSAWGGTTVSVFRPEGGGGRLVPAGQWQAGRHPSALLLNGDGSRLFVASGSTDRIAVLDTRDGRLVKELSDAAPAGPREGSTPNALALSANGLRLFVAEADNNAVAVFDLAPSTAHASDLKGSDTLAGRIPVGWYPTTVAVRGDTLFVVNGKGRGTGPNRDLPHPGTGTQANQPRSYTLGQLSGSLTVTANANARGADLARLTTRTAVANNWTVTSRPSPYPPIRYVIYVIKENRSYDQVFGDLPQGDGDTALVFFPRAVSPNHHALAERFGLFDRFFVNAEVSPDGHNWSMAAYATDYLEKTVPSNYSSRGRSYDYEGTNRGRVPADAGESDVAEPANGYLWDLVQRAGLTLRNYGEFAIPDRLPAGSQLPPGYRGVKPFLVANTNHDFPGFDLDIRDQRRADIFIAEYERFAREGTMPRLLIVRLPNDHTAGARAGAPTPRAYMADNDLALGRLVAAVSATPLWRETAIFVVEDDAQNGPDHVDSHRSPFLAISPYTRRGVYHRFTNTTDVLATIEEILGLSSLSQFDHFGRPLRDIWTTQPDLRPFVTLTPSIPLDQRNPQSGRGAEESKRLALDIEDMADEDLFNRILWRVMKGENVPFPGVARMSALEWKRSR